MNFYFFKPSLRRFSRLWKGGRAVLIFILTFLGLHLAYASGNDLLQSVQGDVTATVSGTGKIFLYVGEMVAAIITFIATRKYTAFIGVIAIAIFIDVLMKIAGISS